MTDMAKKNSLQTDQQLDHVLLLTEYELRRKEMEDTKTKLQEILKENQRLTAERDASQRETYEVTEFLRRDLQQKTSSIEQMQSLIQKTRVECEAEKVRAKTKAQEEIDNAKRKFREEKKELDDKIATLQKELNDVAKFRARQKEIEEVVFNFQAEKKSLQENYHEERKNLEQNFFEETNRLRSDFEHQLAQQKLISESEQEKYLDTRVKQILNQNRRLAIELSLHKQETQTLQRELRVSEDHCEKLNNELEFRASLEEGYSKRNAQQATHLRASQKKCEALENSMKQVITNLTKSQQEKDRKVTQQLEDLHLEADGLRNLIKTKNRECLTLRHLAQQVLVQRRQVERFLLSGIHLVRKEKEQSLVASVKVDEMNWSDRERVLKILLAKMRSGVDLKSAEVDIITGMLSKEGPVKPT